MGIIRIYRSSVTHWCKFSVHTLCCSQDRAVFLFSPNKTAPSQESCFPTLKYHRPSLYWVMLKAKFTILSERERSWSKFIHAPQWQSSYGDKNQAWSRRILGLPSGAGISLKAASGKEQEMVSGNTCDLSDLWYYQSHALELPLVRTGSDGWVPILECQLTWIHAIFLCYFRVSAIASSPCESVWLYMVADNWSLTLYTKFPGFQ